MTKHEMVTLLRSVGCDENTVIAMSNAYEMGAEYEREECAKICAELADTLFCHNDKAGVEITESLRDAIRARGNP